MSLEEVVATTQRLTASMEALVALGAALRIETDELEAPAPVVAALADVTAALGVGSAADLTPEERVVALSAIDTFVRQGADLLDAPDRPPGWRIDDPATLQTIGRLSGLIGPVLGQLAPTLDGLSERLAAPDGAILDVGTGTGWLAIALARTFPAARVVGLDLAAEPLALARENVVGAGLADRIELRKGDAAALGEAGVYDLVWLPTPFIPEEAVPAVLAATRDALRPGGWVVFGLFAGPDDRLGAALTNLRVTRFGGRPWTLAESEQLLTQHGFVDVWAPARTWAAPAAFAFGRRP